MLAAKELKDKKRYSMPSFHFQKYYPLRILLQKSCRLTATLVYLSERFYDKFLYTSFINFIPPLML